MRIYIKMLLGLSLIDEESKACDDLFNNNKWYLSILLHSTHARNSKENFDSRKFWCVRKFFSCKHKAEIKIDGKCYFLLLLTKRNFQNLPEKSSAKESLRFHVRKLNLVYNHLLNLQCVRKNSAKNFFLARENFMSNFCLFSISLRWKTFQSLIFICFIFVSESNVKKATNITAPSTKVTNIIKGETIR